MVIKRTFICILPVLFILSCHAPKDLVFQNVQDFKLQEPGLKSSKVSMGIRLYNPNRYRLKLKNATMDVFLNGNLLGTVSSANNVSIPRLDTFLLPMSLEVAMQNVLPNALQLLINNKVDVKVKGIVKAGRHGIYINVPVDYEGRQDIRSGIKW